MIDSYRNGSTASWIVRDSTGTALGYSNGTKPYAYATDGLGSTVAVITQNGGQQGACTYGPHGETTLGDGWQTGVNLIRYTGGGGRWPAAGPGGADRGGRCRGGAGWTVARTGRRWSTGR